DGMAGGMLHRLANYRNGWKREATLEYFEPEKNKTYEGTVDIGIINDYSIQSAQKSFFAIGKTPGAWAGSSLENYFDSESNRLVIQTNKSDNDYKIREYLIDGLLGDTSVGRSAITPCILFLDGEYWGVYMLRAEYDDTFIQEKYGIAGEDIVFSSDDSFDGLYDFVTTNDMSNGENYAAVEAMMDMQSYLDYFCSNMYLANAMYGNRSGEVWRTVNNNGGEYTDGRWRWLIGSMESTIANGMNGEVSTPTIDTFLQPGVTEDKFLQSLLRSSTFKQQLSDTMKNMSENIFNKERTDKILNRVTKKMEKTAMNSYERYHGSPEEEFYSSEVEKIQKFFEERGTYILRYTEEFVK
ncbi:MAG: CotH kinase family protein, partial [Lachnospiraceae bacterium]|nr:CotH kinase family protein [Lachnospiraceae bacterium]